MAKKLWSAVAPTMIVASLLAGCGGSTEERTSVSTTTISDTTAPVATSTNPVATTASSAASINPPTVAKETAAEPVAMPNVVGMIEADALAELAALGVTDVKFIDEPTLADAGTVVGQVPSEGAEVRGPVTLELAVPLPPMPDYVGTRVGDVRTELEAWGVTVTESQTLTAERPDGEVIATVPAAGEVIGSEVRLEVATAPVVGRLGTDARLVEVDGKFRNENGPIDVNGELFENSVYAYSNDSYIAPGDLQYWEFNLSRDWEKFDTSFGLSDGSEFEQRARFRVLLDGNEIWSDEAGFGELKTASLNVSGGLRLRLEVVSLGSGRIGMVWGDPTILGIPGVVPEAVPNEE